VHSLDHIVPKEFAQLTPENVVFKLMGPVLVKQDQTEAKHNVDTRLEFIRGEMSVQSFLLRCMGFADPSQQTSRSTVEGDRGKTREKKD
jgi:hypothetical protein